MNQLLSYTSKANDKKRLMILIVLAIFCVVGCISTVFAISNQNNNKILKNVWIGETAVGGMTKDQARETIQKQFEQLGEKQLTLSMEGSEYTVSVKELGIHYFICILPHFPLSDIPGCKIRYKRM